MFHGGYFFQLLSAYHYITLPGSVCIFFCQNKSGKGMGRLIVKLQAFGYT